jgi:tetratricopeptide (TPR) repeat protein
VNRRNWFRNVSWSPEIEQAFFRKLERARDKSQYLRIQASNLASRHPEIALRLLERYFALGEHFDMAQAHMDRAIAHLTLNQVDSAIRAYEAALAHEANFPRLKTQAFLQLPLLIAKERLSQHYDKALALLEAHQDRLVFPEDRFSWNCAIALIRSEQGDRRTAKEAARKALAASSESHSGFRYHRKVGLVQNVDVSVRQRLTELAEQKTT